MAEASEELSLPRVKGVKLLCSYAGRILPRPSDGKLRYIGGETRIIVVNRDITYSELMARMLEVHSQTMALKYQLPDEDLDTLVSICSDEDIEIMIDEYDDREGGSRIRVFLFSSIEHDKEEHKTAVAGGIESGFAKRSESAASDGMRDLDDFAGLDLGEGRSHLSSEETVPSPSSAPQWLDGVPLLEQHLQLHAPPSASQAHSQLISFQSIESPSLSSIAPSKQITVADNSASIFSKEHGGGTSPVQLPLPSALNAHGLLASGFGDLANFLESQKLLDVLSWATKDHTAQQHAGNQLKALVPEQNLEAHDFKEDLLMANGHVDAHSFEPSHTTQSSQYVASIVGCKDTESQHQKDFLMGPSMNWQTCAAVQSSLASHPVNSTHLSEIQSVSLAPLVCRRELQRQGGSEQQNEACQKDTSKSLWPSSPPLDTHSSPKEFISRRQVSANMDTLFSEIVGASDTVTLTHHQDRQDLLLASVVPVNVPVHPTALEPQQVAEGRHMSLQDDKENQPVTLGNQKRKAHLSKAHPTCEAKLIMEHNPNLSLQEMKQKDLEFQKERQDRDDLSMRVVTTAGLVQPNYQDLELNQKLEAFHEVKVTLVKFSDGDVQSESASSIAQCSKVHNEQFENHPQLGSNDLSPEKHPLQPGMLELNSLDAINTCHVLSSSRGLDKVVTLERLDSSCNDVSGSSGLASEKHSNGTQIVDVVQEAQAAAKTLAGVGDASHLLSHFPRNESHKEENLHTKVTVQEDTQLRSELLNKSLLKASDHRVSTEHILETTAMTSHLSSLTTTANVIAPAPMHAKTTVRTNIVTPEKILSSSLTKMPATNTSPLMSASGVANNVDCGHSSRENLQESLHDTDTTTMPEFQETCDNSASEQIERREDTMQHLNALPNERVQGEVVLEVNAVNAEVVVFEDPTMDMKSEDDKSSTFSMTASEAEVEAFARGLQIIRNADLEERRELGSGTFGTVYYGKWRGSDVAIKRINSSCFSGLPSERERQKADFWKEACILAQLHHPNVVAFYGVVPDGPDGTLAMVTEFMVNGSIKQVLRKKIDRILDPRRRLFIAMDSAFGMEYLHSKKIVHFDLKCENLFVNVRDPHRPICKVGDFGLSKMKQRTFVSGGVRGTLPWMAPELLNGSSNMVSEKVDVYSFGIVMWELLTGEEPYADLHYGAILGGILNENLRPTVPEGCDPAWRLLMERCWSADPVDRPSFPDIASALRLMAATQLVKVQRPNQLAQESSILQEYVS